ncbi:MAG: SufS family cysteine desulfurase [Candidatus Sericytochromatia bacterium]|nr:SufS family cysteine desulfurase [Candidatus Sericytochromatia bacterium]
MKPAGAPDVQPALDPEALRADFPILGRTIGDKPLVYLDNAASTQLPRPVLDRLIHYHTHEHANVHRGVHTLSQEATQAYEGARERVRAFLNAAEAAEVIFTRGTTEAINLVASSFGAACVREGDEILVTALEHHANLVPWQMLCERTGARLVVAPINDAGELVEEAFLSRLGARTRLVAITHVSNALGTILPVKALIAAAHAQGVPVLVDGAQAVLHQPVDVRDLDADFYVFSGHKLCAPTGIGVLYGKRAWLDRLPPWQGGGDMIRVVTYERTTYNDLPYKFEAGTPPIAAAIGLGAAIAYLEGIGLARIAAHEQRLLERATGLLSELPGVRLIGTAAHKAAVISFEVAGVHPHDVGSILDGEGIAIRAGHHCAQPLMARLGVPATARASFTFYNTLDECEVFARGVRTVQEIFG